jgi:uncharacterized membrane protein
MELLKLKTMKKIILFLSITFMAGIAFANMYNSIVDTTSWISDVPASILAFRQYYQHVNPGSFFRIFSPLNQVLALVSVVVFWKTSPRVRLLLIIAFLLAVSGDVLTFAYFYPRNDLLISLPIKDNTGRLTDILRQWRAMNWMRTIIILAGLAFLFAGLERIYGRTAGLPSRGAGGEM